MCSTCKYLLYHGVTNTNLPLIQSSCYNYWVDDLIRDPTKVYIGAVSYCLTYIIIVITVTAIEDYNYRVYFNMDKMLIKLSTTKAKL